MTLLISPDVEITSFGYLHGPVPAAHLTFDLREHFRDPHVDPTLKYLTAQDEAVRKAVLSTDGIPALIEAAAHAVNAYVMGVSGGAVRVATGCAGGRHRAPSVALALAERLDDMGLQVVVHHRDLAKPVVERTDNGTVIKAPWPAGVHYRYPTLGGATVDVSDHPESGFAARCLGCGDSQRWGERALHAHLQPWAHQHARVCTALLRPAALTTPAKG